MTHPRDPDAPSFLTRPGGAVHVRAPGGTPVTSRTATATALAFGLLGRTLCGLTAQLATGWDHTAAFNDSRLCRTCYRAWPHDTALLFDHPQADDAAGSDDADTRLPQKGGRG